MRNEGCGFVVCLFWGGLFCVGFFFGGDRYSLWEGGKKDKAFKQKCSFCLELKRAEKSKHLSVSFLILFLILIEDQRLKIV